MEQGVSVVIPTIPGREGLLLERCLPSVHQAWPWGRDQWLQVVVVSDRNPNISREAVERRVPNASEVTVVQLNESWRTPEAVACVSAVPWQVGSLLALGGFVFFLGDDDEFGPDHVERHLDSMRQSGADFSISQVQFMADGVPQFVVGNDSMAHGHLDASGLACRSSVLSVANWSVSGMNAAAGDWRLVQDWLRGGLRGVFVGEGPTAVHHDGWVTGHTGKSYS